MAQRYIDAKFIEFVKLLAEMPGFSKMLEPGVLDYLNRRKIADAIKEIGEDPTKIMLNAPTNEEDAKWGVG